jgi:hypothetical protein
MDDFANRACIGFSAWAGSGPAGAATHLRHAIDDPLTLAIMIQLNAVDAALKRLCNATVVARFVRAEDVHNQCTIWPNGSVLRAALRP